MTKRILTILALMLAMNAMPALAQLGPKDGNKMGPFDLDRVRPGQIAPDFTLENFNGKTVTLSDFRGKKTVVLVFYRGHWSPSCEKQLGELNGLLSKQEKDQTQILTASNDSHEDSKKFIQKLKERWPGDYDFPFLEDKDHKVIDRYGIRNLVGAGWPQPSTFVIDLQGMVRWKFVETNPAKRPTNAQILAELKKLK